MKFRDAELKVKYPDRPAGYYGSIQPLCQYACLTELTAARTATLKQWLAGTEEGDMCAGRHSRKVILSRESLLF